MWERRTGRPAAPPGASDAVSDCELLTLLFLGESVDDCGGVATVSP